MQFKYWFYQEPVLHESKQSVINIGYPEIIYKILEKEFGKNAFIIAKWNKEYLIPTSIEEFSIKNWWKDRYNNPFKISLADLTDLYSSAKNKTDYINKLKQLEFEIDSKSLYDSEYLQETREDLEKEIKNMFLKTIFFSMPLIQEIKNKTITDLAPYRKLTFQKAHDKYDAKNIFKNKIPLKTYPTGYKWIDVGRQCVMIGRLMKNCGSAGVMGTDEDRTLMVLFDAGNKPHAMVTYSPNQKRIHNEEGAGSSTLKSEYEDYVIDLAKTLNAVFIGKLNSKRGN